MILIIIAVLVLIGLLRGPSEKTADTILKPEQTNNVTESTVDSRYAPPEQNYDYEQQNIPTESDKVDQLIQKADEQYEYERYDTALEYYDEALEIEPQNEAAWCGKALTYVQLGQKEEAIKCLDIMLEKSSNNDCLSVVAFAYSSLEQYNKAIMAYDKILDNNPKNEEAWRFKGCNLDERGNHEEAIECFDNSLSINPNNAYTWEFKGNSLYSIGKYEEAIECYNKALEIEPEHGSIALFKDRAEKMLHESTSTTGSKTTEDTESDNIDQLLQKAQEQDEYKNYDMALNYYNQVLEIEPGNEDAWSGKGLIYYQRGQKEEAIKCLDKIFENSSDNEWLSFVAQMYSSFGMFDKAIMTYDKILDNNPKNEEAWRFKGWNFYLLGNYEDALKCFDNALSINPNDAFTWQWKGDSLYSLDKYSEAIRCYDEALGLNPEDYMQKIISESKEEAERMLSESASENDSPDQKPTEETPTEQTPSSVQDSNLTVHFIDVGQGDSILVEYGGKTMLIDAGEKEMGSVVSAYLNEQKISSLDDVVATHPHADHIGGLLTIINKYPISQFIDSGVPHTTQTYEDMLTTIDNRVIPFHVAERGEYIDFAPGVEIQVLNPGNEQSEDLNENSVVLRIVDEDVSFLLMGDAGLETEANIIAAGYDIDADILKVGHHGSTSASGQGFISAVSPEISVIEVGAGNDYGHPHAEILQRLQSVSTVYRTDYDGNIIITTDGSTYTVTTEKTAPTQTITDTTTTPTSESEDTTYYSTPTSTSEDTAVAPVQTSTSGEGVYVTGLDLKNEWVKIKNSGSSTVDLTGWDIRDEDNKHTYTFPSFQLEAGATVTLHTEDGTNTGTELYWGSGNSIWNNDGDTAFLYDSSGNLVSSQDG